MEGGDVVVGQRSAAVVTREQTIAVPFGFMRGLRVPAPAGARIVTAGRRTRVRELLAAVAVPIEGRNEELCSRILDLICDEYAGCRDGSATACLARALRAANVGMYQAGAGRSDQRSQLAGVAAAVIRGGSCYVAVIGPVMVVRRSGDRLTFVPNGPEATLHLGSDRYVEPRLWGCPFADDDTLLLATPGLATGIGAVSLERSLSLPLAEDTAERLVALYELSRSKPAVWGVAIGPGKGTSVAPSRLRRATPDSEKEGGAEDGHRRRDPGQLAPRERRHELVAGTSRRLRTAVTLLRSGLDEGARRLTSQPGPARVTELAAGSTSFEWLWRSPATRTAPLLGGALAVALGAILLSATPWAGPARSQTPAPPALTQAEQRERDARAAGDPATERQLLLEARALAKEARDRGALASTEEVANRIDSRLEALNGVVWVGPAAELTDFTQVAKDSDPADLVVQGLGTYVLDRAQPRVFKQLVEAEGHASAPAIQNVWQPPAGSAQPIVPVLLAALPAQGDRPGALLCIDASGAVVDLAQPRESAGRLSGVTDWKRARVATSPAGLFVLAPEERLLARIRRNDQAWQQPEPATTGNGDRLAGAIDVAADAGLFVLNRDGRIEHYFEGKLVPFSGDLPDTDLKAPTRIFTSVGTRSVYVADPENRRVVRFAKSGRFEQQYVTGDGPNVFADLRAFHVDEARGRLFVLSGRKLFLVALPR
ncbi:MAG: hypothetical protein HY329_27755 [Chloroflexi bacterium]|nr:hypothetical protein [Chloroflexota bacterium]